MNVIECKGLTKAYGRRQAIRNLSFTIEENKITGLIGRNGAGKTTLLKVIAGFFRKTSGEVHVFSYQPFNNLKVSANMIFIDDNITPPTALNLQELLESAASFYNNFDMELAKRLFDYFSFHPKQTHQSLSKGMKSTFNVIVGLAARCPLTIFDEPTTGMDSAVRRDFYRALLKDYIEHPRTIIISSHLLDEMDDMLEDILLMKEGQVLLHSSVLDLQEYAIAVSGNKQVISNWTKTKEVLYKKDIGVGNTYVVVRNELNELDKQQAHIEGLEISPVSIDDLSVHLTSNDKGGIDDVFTRD
ncbi:ABC transporter ATP-binding protein [Aquibacillus rhizosphaerae]|uniref:ABC transporter ATP-binding protein n=1 Tax=Aquibacillus rhizosphaerae TaxID=3051431 RepID=A0ABT7LA96_9BACI|nr:ABC transporter ATP-binding protein [Aquibacillus sp. LR5S19]MDL4842778.1 ABC transporter ATP-binding protein [Aquibacillus sp. LR5S19]